MQACVVVPVVSLFPLKNIKTTYIHKQFLHGTQKSCFLYIYSDLYDLIIRVENIGNLHEVYVQKCMTNL